MEHALGAPATWQAFLEYKQAGGHLTPEDAQALHRFIDDRGYVPVVEKLLAGNGFAPPKKAAISKLHAEKKRIVYTYRPEENQVLKVLTWLLQQKYDSIFAPGLYSFRPGKGAQEAIKTLTGLPELEKMHCYKLDISNYFNSVPVEKLLPRLRRTLADEPVICAFLERLLTDPRVEDQGVLIREEKGIMAGTPISAFLANLYLSHMDHHFAGAAYARYSDDIILFAPTPERLEEYISQLHSFLAEAGLKVNREKEARCAPGEAWSFLGICYRAGQIDISPVSAEKLKAKMRRKTRALMRWKKRTGATGDRAAQAFIRIFHRKLFENPAAHELTWARWYFPLITTAESLKAIDAYSQSCIRYLATGKRTKAAYHFTYAQMKALGYQSLVNRYYKHDIYSKGD